MRRTSVPRVVVALVAVSIGLLISPPAQAVFIPGPPGGPAPGPNTDFTMTGVGPGQTVSGSTSPTVNTFDPTSGYPAAPPADFVPVADGFAGIITGESVDGGPTLSVFCIDLHTTVTTGMGYEHGTWDETNVPNLGYIERILVEYYPNTGQPTAAPNDTIRAAAVQAAIWFFSDEFVLSAADPVRPYTEAIVAAVLAAGPLAEPAGPTLTIAPAAASAVVGTPAGPFTIASGSDPAITITVEVTGGTMYADAGATTPIASGATVPNNTQVWVLPDGGSPGTVTISARGSSHVLLGNVFLYDSNTSGVTAGQKLILALDSEISTSTTASATFALVTTGSLLVTKTIAGEGAGLQGPVTVHVACSNGVVRDLVIAAGAMTGDTSTRVDDLPAGTSCDVTEPGDGDTDFVDVAATYVGNPATVVAGGTAEVRVTNTYSQEVVAGEDISNGGGDDFLAATGAPRGLVGLAGAGMLLLGSGLWLLRRSW